MSENKDNEQLDAFSKALLDKKVDMKLHPEMNSRPVTMTDEERAEAEKTLSSALDMLRVERGQKTIEQEEQEFEQAQEQITYEYDDEDDFTTSSIEQEGEDSSFNFVHSLLEDISIDPNEVEDEDEEEPLMDKIKAKKKEREEKKPEKKKRAAKTTKKKKSKSKVVNIVLVVLLIGLVALGGYSYKVLIYDPQNTVSTSQQETYDKLVSYADEYGDNMMSDAEKLELINLNSGYKKLLDKQKTSINTYFKEQTGKNYKALLKEIKELKLSKDEASYPSYSEIMSVLESWDSASDETKMSLSGKDSDYNSFPSNLQKKVNALSKKKTGKEFLDLVSEETSAKQAYDTEQAQKAEEESQNAETKALLEQYLAQAQANLEAYQNYGQSLQEELQSAQQNGEDTTDIQSAIDTNNQMISQIQAEVSSYQQQIAAL